MKVLIIEDNEEVTENASLCFKLAWSQVNIITSDEGGKGIDLVEIESPDIVILGLEFPDADGFKVLKEIRSFSDVPIIILTAREADMDKAKGLETGADDYITSPFNPIDLIARVKAVLRRCGMNSNYSLPQGIELDAIEHQVSPGDRIVDLTPTEFHLLNYLALNSNRLVPYPELAIGVWGRQEISSSNLKFHLCSLFRRKLGKYRSIDCEGL